MPFRRFLSVLPVLVLALFVSACGGGAMQGGNAELAAESGGSSTLIVRAQIAAYSGQTALDVVRQYNRRWLRETRGDGVAGPRNARVVIDGGVRRELDELARIRADDVESMSFLSSNEATRKYGPGFEGGVIELTSRGR